jgi:hypothetical protein
LIGLDDNPMKSAQTHNSAVNSRHRIAIEQGMWRLMALLWSAVEWCEQQAVRRRVQYCLQQRQRTQDLAAIPDATINAKVRGVLAFVIVLIVGSH